MPRKRFSFFNLEALDLAFREFEDPIRSEILDGARLKEEALRLARRHKIMNDARMGQDLAPRLQSNKRILEKSYHAILKTIQEGRAITPAAEWLVDNFHIVRGQLQDIHDHLPPRYYRELPKLSEGPLAGFPRVYAIAWDFVARTDSRFDPELFKIFLKSYQTIQPLTIGELWAVSITFKIVLVENLRRLSARIVGSQIARKEADDLADEILGLSEDKSRSSDQITASLEKKPLARAFAVQTLQRLRFQGIKADPVLHWLDRKLAQEGHVADEIVTEEHASQTAANETVRNIITSSRLMSAYDWQSFFEDVSLVEEVMQNHPGYGRMDFTTRNRYREAIEELSRSSRLDEVQIAQKIIEKANHSSLTLNDLRATDPGYYLISSGRKLIEKEIGFKPKIRLYFIRAYRRHATALYLFSIALLTIFILRFCLQNGLANSHASSLYFIFGLVGIFPASEIAIAVINRLTIALLGPQHLPRWDLSEGIPNSLRTFVVVPTLISDPHKIEGQLEQLEIHYLSNSKGDVYFALLTDGLDALEEHSENDTLILKTLNKSLRLLNEKYGLSPEGFPHFYVFHRRRQFNAGEGKWIGWERKRGKLLEFNRLLRGDSNTSFISIDQDDLQVPPNVRFVITLDADTRLPVGSVAQLVGTLAHPLNRACLDPKTKRINQGYGILQPRITPSLPTAKDLTVFQRFSTGPSGIDPYASAVSDIYQDLFGEGSYTGKGIYDVDAFEAALKNRIPENSLLSHDLFEGNFARCGFVSDVEFFEDFPSHSEVAMSRAHRWTRGDWQLIPWIFGPRGNDLPLIARWKMFDNLRRSLVSPFIFFLVVLSLIIPIKNPALWLILASLSLGVGAVISLFTELFPHRRNSSFRQHLGSISDDLYLGYGRFGMLLILLPHQTWTTLDAIARALYRLFFSHRKMLEWTTAAQSKAMASLTFKSFLCQMWGGLLLTAATTTGLLFSAKFLWSIPFIPLWLASPWLALLMSRPPRAKLLRPLGNDEILYLHETGRRIWRFFSTFVTAEENFLPPDNFQETPSPVVAHRSSPTNFGLYLLSVISARDFFWIGLDEMTERLEQTLSAMRSLPRHQGHFFNWYETTEARPLEPKYISSVDNGNLAGHLLAVGQACLESLKRPVLKNGFHAGIRDSFRLLEKSIKDLALIEQEAYTIYLTEIREMILSSHLAKPLFLRDWHKLKSRAQKIIELSKATADHTEVTAWADSLLQDTQSIIKDLNVFFPWWSTEFSHHEFLLKNIEISSSPYSLLERLPLLINELPHTCETDDFKESVSKFLEMSLKNVRAQEKRALEMHQICLNLFYEMDFKLLYNPSRKLFSIGLRVAENVLDDSYYDLLASEARLTSFIAIAKGDIPASHWFRLGRGLTLVENQGAALISWSGSMFEYLMPSLVMSAPEGSLLDHTCRLVVNRQIQYGFERKVPWGISESAYNKRDLHLTYQYSNFGVPDLGLKRGLGADLVVAPYATLLALMYDSASSLINLYRLQSLGGLGPFGFYEALDYTPSRLPEGQKVAVISAYMAHHQGMSLVAINHVLKNGVMRERFHAEPIVQAAELLLQERTPRNVGVAQPLDASFEIELVREDAEHVSRKYHTVHRPVPTTQLLSNGEYTVMLTSSGSGYSRYRDLAVSRWREDVTCDHWGSYIYLKDLQSEKIWSAGFQPTCVEADRYEVTFSEDRARINREDDKIICELEVFVSPEDQGEVRKLTLVNVSLEPREIEITSYSEIVLNKQLSDQAHPAFSNLFVQTEFDQNLQTLLATRRPRSSDEKPIWMAHLLFTEATLLGPLQYETDRMRFIGRDHSVYRPKVMNENGSLSNTSGSVLDPIASLRVRVRLEPGMTTHFYFSTLIANSKDECLRASEKFRNRNNFERVASLAWTQAQVKLHYLNIEPDEAHLFQRLTTRLLYLDSSLRPSSEMLKRSTKDVTGLWAHGISGDHPIILVRIDDIEDRGIIRQLLKAHEYLASKRFIADLVILNDKANSYAQELQNSLESMVHVNKSSPQLSQTKGQIFILRADLLSIEDRLLLYSCARIKLSSRHGSLSEQVKRMRLIPEKLPLPARKSAGILYLDVPPLRIPSLQFFNGLGGFSESGHEYVIVLKKGKTTPAPWLNVIANPQFGFQVSQSGSGYTWAMNSRENQITPWTNDPVCDPIGEAFYIRDLDSGALWSPTVLPIRNEEETYLTFHGQGYTRFENQSHGMFTELLQFVDIEKPVKISKLKIRNLTKGTRRVSLTSYVDWVLGFSKSTMALTTVTEIDEKTGALFAYNPRSSDFGRRISFLCLREGHQNLTADRTEFIGRNGHLSKPAGLLRETELSGRVGAGLDPCGVLQTEITLDPLEEKEISFFLGQAENREQAQELIQSMRTQEMTDTFKKVQSHWDHLLLKIQVKSPNESMNLMLNGWLLYQTLACRFWARAAFYQAGGAFGFRDQLQDVMALVMTDPRLARDHILLAASRQFIEGDVQHWWHPPSGRGVRTHFSDDLLWLPYVVSHYLQVTLDFGILDEQVTFIEAPLLVPEQEDSYDSPRVSTKSATLYEHCARTLDRSLATGTHGLPLIGSGDWNDGMNRVGTHGKGESVWLGWFLYANLIEFFSVATKKNDLSRAETWLVHARQIQTSIETQSWDGDWYRRAYFDDGTPLGSTQSEECKIDSLVQTWALISGGGDPMRAKHAMESVERFLIHDEKKIILLFTPPFDKTTLDPGYIKGYLPGVRENGGQYTHAAVWCIIAYALMGQGRRASELFNILNPINHALTESDVQTYKVEPYVLAADVYSQGSHTGRGGWTWYTGSSGWMYRAGLEYILGLKVSGKELKLNPHIPPEWKEYRISYRHGESLYEILVLNPQSRSNGIAKIQVDGKETNQILLLDDGQTHQVLVTLGEAKLIPELPSI